MWVADHPDHGVVGLVGLILDGRAGEVEPVVVSAHRRGQGIGRALLDHVAREARGRAMTSLTVSPAARNAKPPSGACTRPGTTRCPPSS